MIEAVGFGAGLLCAIAFIPQLLRIFKLKSSVEISLPFTVCFLAGVITWLIFGIGIGSLSVIVWNAIMAILAFTMLLMKLRYGRSVK